MNETTIRGDGTAIAPVLGLMLMLGITVLLAATVGAFATGIESPERDLVTATDLSIGLEADHALVIEHEGGHALPVSEIVVIIEGATPSAVDGTYSLSSLSSLSDDDDMTAASEARIDERDFPANPDFGGASIRIVEHRSQERTVTLAAWDGPES